MVNKTKQTKRVKHKYLKIPNDHSSIQTHTAVLVHFVSFPRHNTQLPTGPNKTQTFNQLYITVKKNYTVQKNEL